MKAQDHPFRAERLQTLQDYGVLDSYEEQDFDEIVKLAARLCDVPTALISLVDADRQWFKAKVGFPASETPLEQSICSHAILQDGFFEIEDTTADPRTADNSLVTGPEHVRFYAGAQLVAANGLPIGTLCVLDTKPRRLTDLQRDTLQVLARQVMKQLELKLALRNQEVLRAEMDHRVKNSLQATSSLIRVYGRAIKDPGAREALEAVQRRIDAMTALHRLLQDAGQLADIDMSHYLPRVTELLRANTPRNVTLTCHADPIRLDSAIAANIAVIVNEFTANSLKHGFPDGHSGEVSIQLRETSEDEMVLELRDTGIGASRSATPEDRTSGIGLSIMAAAASSIGGTLTNDVTPEGAHLTLTFRPGSDDA